MAVDEKNLVPLLDWYQTTFPRSVDLVGDYAGSELFLIELDSLLLYVFADPLLDFDEGLQLLQAIHAVELFLHRLKKRKCNFALVALQQNADLCVPSHANSINAPKYALARAIIMQHLDINCGIRFDVFESTQDPAFHRHMDACGAYFLMAHDGSHPQAQTDKTVAHDDDKIKRARLRQSIMAYMATGHTVALINGIEFRDTKVLTMVIEADAGRIRSAKTLGEVVFSGDETKRGSTVTPADFDTSLGLESVSMCLAISTIKHLNKAGDLDARFDLSMLLHSWLLRHVPLSSRRISDASATDASKDYLCRFSEVAGKVAQTNSWKELCERDESCSDIADVVDGRLFHTVAAHPHSIFGYLQENSKTFTKDFESLWTHLGAKKSIEEVLSALSANGTATAPAAAGTSARDLEATEVALLPFSNNIFDPHLECVKVEVERNASHGDDTRGIFKELTHWHNTNLLSQMGPKKKPQTPEEARAATRAMRRNQFRMRDMSNYAASLTNSAGRLLEPESVFVQTASEQKAAKKENKNAAPGAPSKGGKQPPTKKGGNKAESKSEIIARETEKRAEAANAKAFQAWDTVLKRIEKESKDPHRRYLEATKYVSGLSQDKADLLEVEILFYRLVQLMQVCSKPPFSASAKPRNFHVAAMIWDHINKLRALDLNEGDLKNLDSACKTMNFPAINSKPSSTSTRKSAFKFVVPSASDVEVGDAVDFQLNHCGPYFDRSIEAESDSRVRFKPDRWQREVLDLIDQRKSAFVVAPTSAGKTFISFYAMKKVLQEDNEGVLVYVAPTKALVNQISAEIQANFNKTYPHAGISVWALHTRDYRINEPISCQILVTVPHVLQIMLLSPANANKFSTRVKRIIFDEIHCIGQAEDGLVWEQLLLLAPCPIVALSATVGNPGQFSDWLKVTQKSNGNELAMVQHNTRYNDLRKYVYVPPAKKSFAGLSSVTKLSPLGIDDAKQFPTIHPVIALVNKSRGMPEDLSLEPRDCLRLWHAMKAASNDKYPLPNDLGPAKCIPKTIRKIDVIRWETKLKELLKAWMADPHSPFDAVHRHLYDEFLKDVQEAGAHKDPAAGAGIPKSQTELIETTLPLLVELNSKGALPALIFNYERTTCESICFSLLEQLEEAEAVFKETSSVWKKKLAEHIEYVKKMERSNKSFKKASAAKDKGSVEEGASKADMLAESAQSQGDKSSISYFRPEDPLDEFSFADKKRATPSEVDLAIKKLQWADLSPNLIRALQRGIGVHHAGMNMAYRQQVEMLFRKGFLRVVIATGTLALGINMPCKTVVFAGDSVFLTALNFRQAAGRAGRRGFDLLGNVVFHGINMDKVLRLISSRLPDLNGHFPVTTSLVLRLFHLLNDSKQSAFAQAAINSLLSQPRLYLGGEDFKEQVLHHLRFSIEYLQRQKLLDYNGAPVNFAGCIMHLYYTESSSFAFHALLKDGFFHRLTAGLDSTTEERILEKMVLVMSHLFGRRPLRQAELEDGYYEAKVHKSPSVVFLEPLPEEAEQTLRAHNDEVKVIFKSYVRTFAEQHLSDKVDNRLPLSEMRIGGNALSGEAARKMLNSGAPNKIRSAFGALSGHDDNFSSIHDLCSNARDGVFLEEAIIPHVPLYPSETTGPLNSYLLDFYKHGSLQAIEDANGIRKGDIWFMLNDFSLVIATIVTSLKNYMNLAESDMLDVRGRGDSAEDEMDDAMAEKIMLEQASQNAATQQAKAAQAQAAAAPKKKKVADSWEDDAEDEDASGVSKGVASIKMDDTEGPEAGFDMREGAGLLKVLRAFERLKVTFDEKFRAIWA